MLDPTSLRYERVEQHVNIRRAIRMYERGELDGIRSVTFMKGVVMSEYEAFRGTGFIWIEVSLVFFF